MSAIPDQGMPGDDLPAEPAQTDLLNAYGAGYTHDDVTAATGADLPRPDISEIWGGADPSQATWSDAASAGPEQYSQWDKTTLPSNAYTLDTPEQARAQINQLAESGMGVGAVESVGGAAVKGILSRAVEMGVTPTTEGLQGAMSPFDLAVERGASKVSSFISNKWVRRGLGAAAAEAAFNNPGGGM